MAFSFAFVISLLVVLESAHSGYIITTPRKWTEKAQSQICAVLSDGTFTAADTLSYKLTELKQKAVLREKTAIPLPTGQNFGCVDVNVPYTEDSRVTLNIDGTLANQAISEAVNLTFVEEARRTYIQTDKYLYKPGQKVQFRILSLKGPNLAIETQNYEEVFITNPSRTRIAQWLNVNNSAGLVHLSFDLFDEAEDGIYRIGTKFLDKSTTEKDFKIEDYVLPRYEVTIESPQNILGSDTSVTIKLCARYTFGEPVSGNATLYLAASSWRVYANLTENKKIQGCQNFTYPTKDLLFDQNNCHIRISSLKAYAKVSEEGTGVELTASKDYIPVHRRAVNFNDITETKVKKAYLPTTVKIELKYPDNSPAKNETVEACTHFAEEKVCKNFTTPDNGQLHLIVPSSASSRIEMRAVNYPRLERNWNDVMEESNYYKYIYNNEEYFHSSNSSLTIFLEDKLNCITGEDIVFKLPVIYVVSNLPSSDLYYQISSRGQIILSNKTTAEFTGSALPFKESEQLLPLEAVPEGVVRGFLEIPVVLSERSSPKISILVWFVATDGSVVADSKEVDVTECLSHKVDFKWSVPKAEPGASANMILTGASNGLCSIGVVDKSVDILSAGTNNLDIGSLLQIVQSAEIRRWEGNDQLNLEYCYSKYNNTDFGGSDVEAGAGAGVESIGISRAPPFYNRYSSLEALHMFNRAGYFVLSDLNLERQYCEQLIIDDLKSSHEFHEMTLQVHDRTTAIHKTMSIAPQSSPVAFSGFKGSAGGGFAADFAPSPESQVIAKEEQEGGIEEGRERSYLPETWLWLLKSLSVSGEINEPMTLPDQITQWVGRAVCIHDTEGVGISPVSSITTFTSFFVDLTLPSSVKRGEILPIKISIFNYLDEDLPVKVTVEPSKDYQFVGEESGVREICITSKQKSVETVKVNLTEIGDVNITIDAVAQPLSTGTCGSGTPPVKKDRFIRSLPVEPEGYLREKTWTNYVCAQDVAATGGALETWVISSPEAIVDGSERSWITAIGDLMGPSVENIGKLVRLPSGCGEQNMVNFAPNVYILQYLDSSNQTTEFIRSKITKFLNQGYQRQLLFRHSNGSFSAFGNKDREGSTWLSAFVLKSLAQAKPFTQIDEVSLRQTAEWLKSLQDKEGCFASKGRVINKMLQGGITGSGGSQGLLAAYILAALLEEGNVTENIVSSAIQCVESDTSVHPYSLALKGYTLALAKAPNAKAVIDQLIAAAANNVSMMRWSLPDRQGENTALHVETAAYALLAMVTLDPKAYSEEARRVVRWITAQRNGQGGFVSTQDTVVALQGLAAFEKAQPREKMDMEITLSSTGLSHAFTVRDDNKFLEQRINVPALPASVAVNIKGQGCALVQGVLRYNVHAESVTEAFTLKVDTAPVPEKDCRTHNISVCTSYTLPDKSSNMAIMEVKLVSGYIPIKKDLKEVIGDGKKTFKRYEVDGPKVIFYLEEITAEQVCASFKVYQEVEIENAKPGNVVVYDYYQPEYTITQKYHLLTAPNCPATA